MAETIVGLFPNPEDARRAVASLEKMSIGHDAIGLIGNNAGGHHNDLLRQDGATGQNITSGAEAGAVVGGATGFVLGAVAFAIPVIGPVVAAGVLASTLAGVGIGAVAGGVIGSLVHAGVPEAAAAQYAEGVRQGGTVLTVHAPEAQAAAVRELLARNGATSDLPPGQFHDIPDSEKTSPRESLQFGPGATETELSEAPLTEVNTGEEKSVW